MVATAQVPKEAPQDEPDDVLFNNLYGLRSIVLNRPKKLNSLNGSMVRKIVPRLKVRMFHGRLSPPYTRYVRTGLIVGNELGMGKIRSGYYGRGLRSW